MGDGIDGAQFTVVVGAFCGSAGFQSSKIGRSSSSELFLVARFGAVVATTSVIRECG